jgi:alkanesulfonate monooxygenase SsuD/methylene tetrahydromethanopterin reductase-like flavin-dependent oxidoreductase (luciferase family)/putative sterol carrier protein
MRFGIFYEHQLPRPWTDTSEADLLAQALEQVELADRLGFDYVWEVEHHFLEEYSHSSAPEVFLGAASQRTRSIRLGHGIVNVMPAVNHPARIAERIATLDLISGGRVEFGTGESSSAAELGGFLIDREQKREMWEEAVGAISRMLTEDPFTGIDGEHIQMPPRNVVPKPLQKPHPPLWVACSRRDTIHLAGQRGIGALSFSFVEPEDAAKWVDEYYALIASDECVPIGAAVNPNLAVVLPMMLAESEAEAIDRGIDGAHFFGYSLGHYYGLSDHSPGVTNVHNEFEAHRDETGFARHIVQPDQAPLGVRLLQEGLGSLRGAIGTPDQVTELVARYEQAGVDQVIFVLQSGANRHEHICESLELFAQRVLPRFAEGREEREAAKAQRLAEAIGAALARRPAPASGVVSGPEPYVIDEPAELGRARRTRRQAPTPGQLKDLALAQAKRTAREQGTRLLARLIDGADDATIERRFGSSAAQRAIFTTMTKAFRPDAAAEFQGAIVYELAREATGADPAVWTVEIVEGQANARPDRAPDAALTVRFQLSDFMRIAAGTLDPAQPLLQGRASFEGDFSLAVKLPEMFGAPSPY